MNDNLVFGMATGFCAEIDKVKHFCLSLRKHYKGPVCITTDNNNPSFVAFLKSFNIDVLLIKEKIILEAYMFTRWFHTKKLIEKHYPNAKSIILSDVRDVIYQDEPFQYLSRDDLDLTAETKTIVECPQWNTSWIVQMYGREVFEQLKHQTILCGGLMAGNRKGIFELCDIMVSEYHKYGPTAVGHPPKFVDQATLNVFYGLNKLPKTTVHKPGEKFAANIGSSLGSMKLNNDNVLESDKGIVPAIVHQYDRHEHLVKAFVEKLEG